MAAFDRDLLPATFSSWTKYNATGTSTALTLNANARAYAKYSYATTGFKSSGYMLFSCGTVSGDVYFAVHYVDEDGHHYSTAVRCYSNMSLVIVLQEVNVVGDLDFYFYHDTRNTRGIIYSPHCMLEEQAIRSVDLEYASGTSRVTPPTTGWSTTPPNWQTDRYIWQRTATTFVDGHTEYSDPVCIQNTGTKGIQAIVEQYARNTSQTTAPTYGWSTTCPSWATGYYIWTRSRITWTDLTVTYSDAVLARAINQANERAEEAMDAVDDLDQALKDPDEIFNRLTDNGSRQGLYIDNNNYYFNATYIKAGVLLVQDTSGYTLFRADMSARSVKLCGFTATRNGLSYGSCTSVGDRSSGVFIGNTGITVGNNGEGHCTMSGAELYGGGTNDNAKTGYINFFNHYVPTKQGSTRVAGQGGVFFLSPRIATAGFISGGSTSLNLGADATINVPRAENIQSRGIVNSVSGTSYSYYVPGYRSLRFIKGLAYSITTTVA